MTHTLVYSASGPPASERGSGKVMLLRVCKTWPGKFYLVRPVWSEKKIDILMQKKKKNQVLAGVATGPDQNLVTMMDGNMRE